MSGAKLYPQHFSPDGLYQSEGGILVDVPAHVVEHQIGDMPAMQYLRYLHTLSYFSITGKDIGGKSAG